MLRVAVEVRRASRRKVHLDQSTLACPARRRRALSGAGPAPRACWPLARTALGRLFRRSQAQSMRQDWKGPNEP